MAPSIPLPQLLLLLLLLFFLSVFALTAEARTPIKVAFAGFPRTGSKSLSVALERLGFRTCHGTDMISGSRFLPMWQALIDKDVDKALELTEDLGCETVFEVHAPYWREIRRKRPQTKFIVVIRDYDRWEASIRVSLSALNPMMSYPLRCLPIFDIFTKLITAAVEHQMLPSDDVDYAMNYLNHPFSEQSIRDRKGMYDRFVKDAKEFLKKEPKRTLLLDFKAGYAPLCEFLGIQKADCPDEALPHVNSTWELRATVFAFFLIQIVAYVAPVLLIVVVWKWWGKQKQQQQQSGDSSAAGREKRD